MRKNEEKVVARQIFETEKRERRSGKKFFILDESLFCNANSLI